MTGQGEGEVDEGFPNDGVETGVTYDLPTEGARATATP